MTDASPTAVEIESLWEFSLRVYDLEGVREACLRLQDRGGADVNLILFGAWSATRRNALSGSVIEHAVALTRKWSEAIIEPLRATRREMKTSPLAAAGDPAYATLRNSVQTAELEGERLLQGALQALVPEFRTASRRAMTIAAGNTLRLLRTAGIELRESTLVDLRAVLLRAFDGPPQRLGELVAAPRVVTSDDSGRESGLAPRLDAHLPPAVRHTAVSVLLVSEGGRWLLQRRADLKCAFGGYWANSCCTHPLPDEAPVETARRRVREELGLDVDRIEPAGAFAYTAEDPETGFVECEYDHVFVARVAGEPTPTVDRNEISEAVWLDRAEALARVEAPNAAPWYGNVAKLAARAIDSAS